MPKKGSKTLSKSYTGSCFYLGGVLSHLDKIAQRWGVQTGKARKEVEDVRRRLDQAFHRARDHV